MFHLQPAENRPPSYAPAIIGLLVMSVAALAVTIWTMVDFVHEQAIVHGLIKQLPASATASAVALEGELRWQFRLTILVVLNLVVTGIAVILLYRAYRNSQESLRDFKALANDILSSMDLAIITTDLSGVVTSLNRRAYDLLALTAEDLRKPLAQVAPDLALEEFRQSARRSRDRELNRDFSVTRHGVVRAYHGFCQPLRNSTNAEVGHIIGLRDVTERTLTEDRLRRMERHLDLVPVATSLQHEIKNPLAALSLHVQLLEEEFDAQPPTPAAQDMMGVIQTELGRVNAVLESFRDFASVTRISRSPMKLMDLLDRLVRLLGPQSAQRGITLTLEAAPTPLPELQADQVKLEQVFLNLLLNAMEAMPGGGSVLVRATPLAATLRVEVIDTGVGIPEDIRERIFDPFFTTKSHGLGMGLAICDKIIRQHQGSLDVRSSPAGTTMVVSLPLTLPQVGPA